MDEVSDVAAVVGGADAALYRVTTPLARYALRVLPPGREIQAAREDRFLRHASAHGLPGPRPVASGVVDDHPVSLMSWVDGQQLAASLLTTGDPEDLGRQFGAVLRQVHALPLPGATTATIPWRHVLPPDLVAALGQVPADPPVVLHLDYHPYNVMVRDGQIVAVLDWANAGTGDPRYDLARTGAILAHTPMREGDLSPRVAAFSASMLAELGHPPVPPAFRWWAGVTMAADLEPKLGHRALPWLTDDWLQRLHDWTDTAREEARRR